VARSAGDARSALVHFCLFADRADHAFVNAVAEGLKGHRWSVFSDAGLQPGDDRGQEADKALAEAACALVFVRADMSEEARSAAIGALAERKRNPLLRVVPVLRGKVSLDERKYSTLNVLKAIEEPDAQGVVAVLHQLAKDQGWRDWGKQAVSIGLVIADEELHGEGQSLCARLKGMSAVVRTVDAIHPDAPEAKERAAAVDLRVVLLRARHNGGQALLRELVASQKPEGGRTLAFAVKYDSFDIPEDREDEAKEVKRLTKGLPRLEGDLTDPIVKAVLDWHRATFPPDPGGARTLEPWELDYLRQKKDHWRCGDPGALRTLLPKVKAERARWFVLLRAAPPWRIVNGQLRSDKANSEGRSTPAWLDQALSVATHPRMVVIGGAGAGKSVLLQHLAWVLTAKALGEPLLDGDGEPIHALDLPALQGQSPLLPIPILHNASTLADALRGPRGTHERPIQEALIDLLCNEDTFGHRADREAVREGLKRGRYLLLFDSLDEVPSTDDRAAIVRALGALHLLFTTGGPRVVLSTRPTAHTDVQLPAGFSSVEIAPLDNDRIDRLVQTWLSVHETGPSTLQQARAAIASTQADFPTDAEGRSPAENPLLLTCIMLVYLKHRRLPDDRAELYYEMVRLLCESRVMARGDEAREAGAESQREALQALFYAMQEAGGTRLPQEAACGVLVAANKVRGAKEAEPFLDRLANRTGLIRFETHEGQRVVRPWHRSFLEYLAARQLAVLYTNKAADCTRFLLQERSPQGPRIADPTWTGCLRFLVGAFGQIDGIHAVACVQDWLDAAAPAGRLEARLLALAAGGAAENDARHFRHQPVRETLRQQIAARFAQRGADWPWEDRLDALEALGRLGDPRLTDPRTHLDGWAWVPQARLWMRTWPVTVAEFAPFVEATGTTPDDWPRQLRRPNVPVTWVDWYEARAFCRWATRAWKRPTAGPIDLPTSAEWEQAANGGTRRRYPWGGEHPGQEDLARAAYNWGNKPFSHRRQTPVGAFPRGHTPDRSLWDLAGNAYEWTSTLHEDMVTRDVACHQDDNPRQGDDRLSCVLCGGSCFDPAWGLRAAEQNSYPPRSRFGFVGFRVLCRSPEPRS
jgi:hypothetical protein